MSISRKHYVAIADDIKQTLEDLPANPLQRAAIAVLVRRLCRTLQDDNSSFRRTQFIEACGLTLAEVQ